MNVCGVSFGGYLNKILSFKTGNLLNNSKFHLLSEGTVHSLLIMLTLLNQGLNGVWFFRLAVTTCVKTNHEYDKQNWQW